MGADMEIQDMPSPTRCPMGALGGVQDSLVSHGCCHGGMGPPQYPRDAAGGIWDPTQGCRITSFPRVLLEGYTPHPGCSLPLGATSLAGCQDPSRGGVSPQT